MDTKAAEIFPYEFISLININPEIWNLFQMLQNLLEFEFKHAINVIRQIFQMS